MLCYISRDCLSLGRFVASAKVIIERIRGHVDESPSRANNPSEIWYSLTAASSVPRSHDEGQRPAVALVPGEARQAFRL